MSSEIIQSMRFLYCFFLSLHKTITKLKKYFFLLVLIFDIWIIFFFLVTNEIHIFNKKISNKVEDICIRASDGMGWDEQIVPWNPMGQLV